VKSGIVRWTAIGAGGGPIHRRPSRSRSAAQQALDLAKRLGVVADHLLHRLDATGDHARDLLLHGVVGVGPVDLREPPVAVTAALDLGHLDRGQRRSWMTSDRGASPCSPWWSEMPSSSVNRTTRASPRDITGL
jgi:hypothetical protein